MKHLDIKLDEVDPDRTRSCQMTFLQGPLGQCSPKPTTLLLGRIMGISAMIFGQYDLSWRPTMRLGGRDSKGWKTSRAKVCPWKLSWAIASAHFDHSKTLTSSGSESVDDDDVLDAIRALSQIFDPDDPASYSSCMQANYHRRR